MERFDFKTQPSDLERLPASQADAPDPTPVGSEADRSVMEIKLYQQRRNLSELEVEKSRLVAMRETWDDAAAPEWIGERQGMHEAFLAHSDKDRAHHHEMLAHLEQGPAVRKRNLEEIGHSIATVELSIREVGNKIKGLEEAMAEHSKESSPGDSLVMPD